MMPVWSRSWTGPAASGSRTTWLSAWNRHGPVVVRIGPAVVGNDRRPLRTSRVPIIGITVQPLVQLAVLAHLVPIQFNPQSGRGGNRDGAGLVAHRAAFDD